MYPNVTPYENYKVSFQKLAIKSAIIMFVIALALKQTFND